LLHSCCCKFSFVLLCAIRFNLTIRIHAKFESILNLKQCGIWKRIWKFKGIFYYQLAWAETRPHPRSQPSRLPPFFSFRATRWPARFLTQRPASARPAALAFQWTQPTCFSIPEPSLFEVNPAWPNQQSRRFPGAFTEGTEGKVSLSWTLLWIVTKSEFKLQFGIRSWSNPCCACMVSKSPINRVTPFLSFAKIEVP
jgi:hypothetical protein